MIRNVDEIHEFPLVARADSRSQALISLIMASLFGLQKMHPVVVKSCGHRMWSFVVSICDVTRGTGH